MLKTLQFLGFNSFEIENIESNRVPKPSKSKKKLRKQLTGPGSITKRTEEDPDKRETERTIEINIAAIEERLNRSRVKATGNITEEPENTIDDCMQ